MHHPFPSDLTDEGRSAWTPVENTYYHFLTFDLGGRKKIRKINTAGRARTHECVTEYIVQYSDDGEMWRSYTDVMGEVQVKNKQRHRSFY